MTDLDPSAFFSALADPTRLALVQLLASLPDEHRQCVRALAMRLGVSQPAVSQHLRVLREVGLVHSERNGPRVHYALDRERLLQGQALLQAIHDTPRQPPVRPSEADCRGRRSTGGRRARGGHRRRARQAHPPARSRPGDTTDPESP